MTEEAARNNLETQTLKSVAKSHEFEFIKNEKKLSEEALKITKLQKQLELLRKNASIKIAENIQKYYY